jgi:hypothetical protein
VAPALEVKEEENISQGSSGHGNESNGYTTDKSHRRIKKRAFGEKRKNQKKGDQ